MGMHVTATRNIIGSPSIIKLIIALIKPAPFYKALANIEIKNTKSPEKKETASLICLVYLVCVVVRIIQKTRGMIAKYTCLSIEGARVIEQKKRG